MTTYKKIYPVRTDTLSLGGISNESLVTFAAVAPHGVLAAAIPTDAWFSCTLVQI